MDSSTESLASSASMEKPLPVDLIHHYSETTKHRSPSKIKDYYKYFLIPGIGQLAGGTPNFSFFPYDTLEAQIAKPERWPRTPNHPGDGDDEGLANEVASMRVSLSDRMTATHLTIPKQTAEVDPQRRIDLSSALQYGQAPGYPPLLSWVRQFTRENLHPNVPYRDGPDVLLTIGATDGFAKTLELFVNPWGPGVHDVKDRPGLLCEPFLYGAILNQTQPKGVQMVVVEADEGGMMASGPGGLEDVLSNWDESKGRRPHLMYTVTMGHNPTGVLLSVERRRELYALCSKYDVIIVEDDPYWFLQFPSAAVEEAVSRGQPRPDPAPKSKPEISSGYDFLDSLVPSFLSVDVDGRVVRLDTFSKTVAPGCRLGWITAQPNLIERFARITEALTQQPSGFVQSMISELVMGPQPADVEASFRALRSPRDRAAFAGWKTDGWVRWLEGLRGMYERRMSRMCCILDEGRYQVKQGTPVRASDADWGVITKTALYDFAWPRGGMFVWLRVHLEAHPLWQVPTSTGDKIIDGTALATALTIYLTTKPHLVLVATGTMFGATEAVARERAWSYFRICFAAETEENIDACSRRFVRGVHRFFRIKKVQELEDILKGAPGVAAAAGNGEEEEMGNLGSIFGC